VTVRKTKIIATVGPACDSPDILEAMMRAGANVFRLNFSHGDADSHRKSLDRVRAVAANIGTTVAVMLDTKGVEIRTGRVAEGHVVLERGDAFTLFTEPRLGSAEGVSVSLATLPELVAAQDRILVDDGKIELVVEAIEKGEIRCRVECGGTLRDRKGVNVPGIDLALGAIDPQVHDDLAFAAESGVDYIAASFMQSARDIEEIRAFLQTRGADIPIIAKIESRLGVANLESIIEAADGAMVARGDLGVEMPMAEVPQIQKQIIRTTVTNGKPVITATQMLDSMERNPRPTRAEVSDVANAILDGTSAVMLSGETAAGAYPVQAVETMASICIEAEASLREFGTLQNIRPNPSNVVTEAVAQASITMANHLMASAIIALTDSGFTARSISKYRPRCPILAVTRNEKLVHKLAMNWGVIPILDTQSGSDDARIEFAIAWARKKGLVDLGDILVATAGRSQRAGGTNMIQVLEVEDTAERS